MNVSTIASPYSWFFLNIAEHGLERYRRELGLSDGGAALESLGLAIAASPGWNDHEAVSLVYRSEPEPLLALVGHFDAGKQAWIQAQLEDLAPACARFRYLSYEQVEVATQRLAECLVQALGSEEIRQARFVAIPRGGYVVAGLLASYLGLGSEQLGLQEEAGAEDLTIFVDDCALTGYRFGQCLAETEHPRIAFAHLCSSPELRVAILEAEPRVEHCLAAVDLDDHTPTGATPAWRQAWRDQIGGKRYWIGRPDALCFPWCEPDRSIRVPKQKQTALGWRLAPPAACLKNRPDENRRVLKMEHVEEGPGPITLSPEVLFTESEDNLLVGHCGTGGAYSLQGSAAKIFRALVGCGSMQGAVEKLKSDYAVESSVLYADVEAFVENLVGEQLVVTRV